MKNDDTDYMTFLRCIIRLRNSLNYVSAMDNTKCDPLGLAAVYELRRLDDEGN